MEILALKLVPAAPPAIRQLRCRFSCSVLVPRRFLLVLQAVVILCICLPVSPVLETVTRPVTSVF